jgi:hypothetical protein
MEIVKSIKFKNTGTKSVDKDGKPKVSRDTLYIEALDLTVPFGEECEIPELYTRPTLCVNGSRGKSSIEQLAPQLEPSDPVFAEAWKRPPEKAQPVASRGAPAAPVTLESLMASGLNKGLAEQMLNAINAARAAKAGG